MSMKTDSKELFEFDDVFRMKNGIKNICGVDEAGRGPLAGPVCCAAVILKDGTYIEGLNDSKKISEKKRELLFSEILRRAEAYSVVFVDNKTIDKINILQATMYGMKKAVEKIKIPYDFVLIDGNKTPEGLSNCDSLVHGDARSASISAASILAKVTRDRYMYWLDRRYPEYGFAKHKGYGTKIHYEAIEKNGITDYHRLSFLKNVDYER